MTERQASIPTSMLPTSANHCGPCVWEKDPNKPDVSAAEISFQQRVLAEVLRDELGLSADQRVITDGDSQRANHRLDMSRWCAIMMTSGLCEKFEAKATKGNVVVAYKDVAADARPKLRSV